MKIAIFGILAIAALTICVLSRREERWLVTVGLCLAVNWLLFAMPWIYAPASPAFIVSGWGWGAVRQENMWALADLICLCVIAVHCRAHFGSTIFVAQYAGCLAVYSAAYIGGLQYITYSFALDTSFLIQVAAIFTLGGPSVRDRVLHRWRGRRLAALPVVVAHMAGERG